MLTRRQFEVISEAARKNPRQFIERVLRIRQKDRQLVPFKFNRAQEEVWKHIGPYFARGEPVRAIIVKARQLGQSTLGQGLAFAAMWSTPGTRCIAVTHERAVTRKLARMGANFMSWLPEDLRPIGMSGLDKLSVDALPCSDGEVVLDSSMLVETATGKEVGRGDTCHFVHASEFGFYPDAAYTMRGLLNSVPDQPNTTVIIESTAKMAGDAFQRRWEAAEDGRSDYVPIFLPWYLGDDYELTPGPDFEATPDEMLLAKQYGLSPAQLFWRRQKIASAFDGDTDAFARDFPITPAEAFAAMGRRLFPTAILSEYRERARAATFTDGVMQGDKFVERVQGPVRLYERPRPNGEYVIGLDVGGAETGDPCAAAVFDRNNDRMVARFHARMDPLLLAHEMYNLGRYFNFAIMTIEINGAGISTQLEMHERLRYPRFFIDRRYDSIRKSWTDRMGFWSSQRSRYILVNDMNYGLRTRAIGIPDVRTVTELLNYDVDRKEVVRDIENDEESGHDDLADAIMLAWTSHLKMPMLDGTLPRGPVSVATTTTEAAPETAMTKAAWESFDRAMKGDVRDPARELISDYDPQAGSGDPWGEIPY